MNFLLINPNTSEFVTERALCAARAAASQATEIDAVTGTFGAPIINSEADLAIGAYSALELAAKHAHDYDAVGLAVSFDCGLEAVRELLNIPVVGLAEASVRQATDLGGRFTVVSFAKRTEPLYLKLMKQYTDCSNLAAVKCLPALATEILKDSERLKSHVEEMITDVVQQTGCDSVILLATAFAGLADDLAVDIPVIDCVSAMIQVMEHCVLDPQAGKAYANSSFPEQKIVQGVSTELARCYERFPSD